MWLVATPTISPDSAWAAGGRYFFCGYCGSRGQLIVVVPTSRLLTEAIFAMATASCHLGYSVAKLVEIVIYYLRDLRSMGGKSLGLLGCAPVTFIFDQLSPHLLDAPTDESVDRAHEF